MPKFKYLSFFSFFPIFILFIYTFTESWALKFILGFAYAMKTLHL